MTSWTRELDEAVCLATRRGKWHVVLFYLLCGLAAVPTSFLVFAQVFTNATPEHWCAPPPELQVLGLPDEVLRNLTVPYKLDNVTFDSCQIHDVDPRTLYAALSEFVDERSEVVREGGALRMINIRQLVPVTNGSGRETQIRRISEALLDVRSKEPVACPHGWIFKKEHYKDTLVTKFELVCDNDWWPRLSNTLFWVGSIFGNLFFGWMSDRYGRRPTILLMIYLEVPLAILASFPTSYWIYTVLRVAGGLFFPALYQLPFILALELMPPDRRTYTSIIVGMLFAGGICLLSLLAFTLRDWFTLSLATSLPFIFLYSYYWLIPESPRWLVGRGRIAEAEQVLRDIAKKNNINLEHGFLLELHKKVKDDEEKIGLTNINGHLAYEKDDYFDRKVTEMLTFKPETDKNEQEDTNKTQTLERIIALEVAELVNKKARRTNPELTKLNTNIDISDEIKESVNFNEQAHLNKESQQKSTQTDSCVKSSPNNLRRKSLQFVSKIFTKDYGEIIVDTKRMDDENSAGDCKASPLDVFRYPNIRKKFFLLTFEWVALGVVYNSLSYNTPNLGVDDYLAFFIAGAVELPSYFIAWKSMDRFGRRWVLFSFLSIGGLACLSCILVPEDKPWVTVSLVMLAKLCSAASFAVFYVLMGELLPTVLRAQAMGAASFICGLGLLACPYIVHLTVYSKLIPLIIMGVLSVMAGVTSLFLPETLNQPLPQTLEDGEMFGRNFKILSCVPRPRKVSDRFSSSECSRTS